jgi:hypothetical protein
MKTVVKKVRLTILKYLLLSLFHKYSLLMQRQINQQLRCPLLSLLYVNQ